MTTIEEEDTSLSRSSAIDPSMDGVEQSLIEIETEGGLGLGVNQPLQESHNFNADFS